MKGIEFWHALRDYLCHFFHRPGEKSCSLTISQWGQTISGILVIYNFVQYTLPWNGNEWRKTEQVPNPLPSAASTLSDEEKTFKKKFCLWTSEIIQFIRFEKHMDGPRYLKFFLGYLIIYLSIWYFMSHGCFTARIMLKCKEKRELRVLSRTVQDQIRENWMYDLSN